MRAVLKDDTSKKGSSNETDKKKKACGHCDKPGHKKSECWLKPGQEHLRPSKKRRSESSNSKSKASKPTFTAEQMTYLIQGVHKVANKKKCKAPKKKKCQVWYDSDSMESDQGVRYLSKWLEKQNFDNSSSDSKSSAYSSLFAINSAKKRKKEHHTTEMVGEIRDKTGETVPICILLDSGTTATIVLRKCVHKNISKYKGQPTGWKTMEGIFTTKRCPFVEFKLPEFSNSRTIGAKVHVDDTTNPKTVKYDIIMCMDLLEFLGIDLTFSKKMVIWDDLQILMKNCDTITDWDVTENIYEATQEPSILRMSEDRHNETIKQMCTKVDQDEHIKMLKHLSNDKQFKLACVLSTYLDMYEGTISTLNIPPVHFELNPMLSLFTHDSSPFLKRTKTSLRRSVASLKKTLYGITH